MPPRFDYYDFTIHQFDEIMRLFKHRCSIRTNNVETITHPK